MTRDDWNGFSIDILFFDLQIGQKKKKKKSAPSLSLSCSLFSY
jgi:hypothetical protein